MEVRDRSSLASSPRRSRIGRVDRGSRPPRLTVTGGRLGSPRGQRGFVSFDDKTVRYSALNLHVIAGLALGRSCLHVSHAAIAAGLGHSGWPSRRDSRVSRCSQLHSCDDRTRPSRASHARGSGSRHAGSFSGNAFLYDLEPRQRGRLSTSTPGASASPDRRTLDRSRLSYADLATLPAPRAHRSSSRLHRRMVERAALVGGFADRCPCAVPGWAKAGHVSR